MLFCLQLYEDPEFLEFLETQKISGSGNKKVWSNDAIEELKKTYNSQMKTAKNSKTSNIVFDDSGNDSADENYQDMIKTGLLKLFILYLFIFDVMILAAYCRSYYNNIS